MAQTKFFSIRELQQQGSSIKNILKDDGKIIITNNGKPIGITIGINEESLEDTLDDMKRLKQLRFLRYIDQQLDESEKQANDPNTEWIDNDTFWAEAGLDS